MLFWLHRLGGVLIGTSAVCALPGLVHLKQENDSTLFYRRLLLISGVLLMAGVSLLVVP